MKNTTIYHYYFINDSMSFSSSDILIFRFNIAKWFIAEGMDLRIADAITMKIANLF